MKIILIICSVSLQIQDILATRNDSEDFRNEKFPMHNFNSQAIVGGADARPGLWKHMVNLKVKIWVFDKANRPARVTIGCAGSIISKHYIITAAHCLRSKTSKHPIPKNVTIKAGDYLYNNKHGIKRKAIKITIHNKYKPGNRGYDLAIIKVDIPFIFNSEFQVKPITLASPKDIISLKTPCFVASWGCTKYDPGTSIGSDIPICLQELPLQYYNKEDCVRIGVAIKEKYQKEPFYCGMCVKSLVGTCTYGDSGAPMICEFDKKYKMTGVVSKGITEEKITYLSSVTSELTWISRNTQ